MPQRIEVPGQGILEFPDNMNDGQIAEAIERNFGKALAPYRGGGTPEERFKAMNPDYKPEAPEWAGKHPNLYGVYGAAKELVPVGTAALGGATMGPMGGAVGYGMGELVKKGIEDLTGEKRYAGSLADAEKELRGDVALGALMETLGIGVPAAIKAGYQGIKRNVPALTQKAAEKKAGQLLAEKTSAGEHFTKNIDEAKRLEGEVEGLKFTRGQRSNDPLAIMQERELAASKVTAAQDVDQRAASNQAIRKYFEKNFPGDENVDDVIANLEASQKRIGETVRTTQEAARKEASRLGSGLDSQESGEVLRSVLKMAKDDARTKAKALYDAVPDVKLQTNELDDAIKSIGQEFKKSGDSVKDYPVGVIKQIQERIKPAEAKSTILDARGNPITSGAKDKTQDIGFQELRGYRTQIREAIQDAERGANPNYKLARRLKALGDSVESTINKMEGAGGEAAQAFREASAFYKQYDKAFRKGTVGEILRPGKQADGYRIANAEVAGRFFKTGKLDAADDLVRGFGGNQQVARESVKDYAAHDLLRSAENPMTGEIMTPKLEAWLSKNKTMLDKFGLMDEFSNLQKAQKSVDAIKGIADTFDKSIATRILGADPEKAIGNAFTGKGAKNSGEAMKELMALTKGDKAAEAGLKKAFAEHIFKQMENSGVDVLNNPFVSVAKGKSVLAKYGPAIRELYKDEPGKVRALMTVHKAYEVLGRNAKSPLGGGSDTAEKIFEAVAQEGTKRIEATPFIGNVLKVFNAYDRQQVRQILSRAVFDPDYAETVVMASSGVPTAAIKKKINSNLLRLGAYGARSKFDKE